MILYIIKLIESEMMFKKMSYLNTNAEVSYGDMKIEADYIQIDWDKGMIFARGKLDSLGKVKEPATATQGEKKIRIQRV